MKRILSLSFLTFFLTTNLVHAKVVFQNEFIIDHNGTDTFVLDALDNVNADLTLQFGNSLAETIHFDTANSWFEFSDSMMVLGSAIIENNEVTQSFRVNDETADATPFLIDENGNVGIKNEMPAAPLDIQTVGQSIELGDGTANDIILTFDDGVDRDFMWDDSASAFNLSESVNIDGSLSIGGNADFNLNQGIEFRIENLGAEPVCNAASEGRLYQNTNDGNTYACDGANYQLLNSANGQPIHYHNGVITNSIITATRNDVVTTGEDTTIYLTDDGTNLGNLLFSEVYHVSASIPAIELLPGAAAMFGYEYNDVTGALTIKFLESETIILGGQGLESEEGGTSFTVFVLGI